MRECPTISTWLSLRSASLLCACRCLNATAAPISLLEPKVEQIPHSEDVVNRGKILSGEVGWVFRVIEIFDYVGGGGEVYSHAVSELWVSDAFEVWISEEGKFFPSRPILMRSYFTSPTGRTCPRKSLQSSSRLKEMHNSLLPTTLCNRPRGGSPSGCTRQAAAAYGRALCSAPAPADAPARRTHGTQLLRLPGVQRLAHNLPEG